MRLVINTEDLSRFYTSARWSGEKGQAARKLEFDLVVSGTDKNLSKPTVPVGGNCVFFDDDGRQIFDGEILYKDKSVDSNTMKVTAVDRLFRTNQSETSYTFENKPIEQVARQVFGDCGLRCGTIARGGTVNRIFDIKSPYEIVLICYKMQEEATGTPYIIRMEGDVVAIRERGKIVAKYELDGKANLLNASYSESGENLVSTVKMFNTNGDEIGQVTGEGKGMTKFYRQEEGEDPATRAKGILKGLEREASVRVLGDYDLITGNAVIIHEPFTGLQGKFYIDGDTHTFANNYHVTELKLSYENTMEDIDTSEQSAQGQEKGAEGASGSFPAGDGSARSRALKIGEKLIGTKYQRGGNTPGSGLDCTGFVDWCYTQAGMNIPGRLTSAEVRRNPKQFNLVEIPWNQRQPGDVLWHEGHCALQYYDGKILESGGHSKSVIGYSGVAITKGTGRRFKKAYRYKGT